MSRPAGLFKLDFKLIQWALRQMDTGISKGGTRALQKAQVWLVGPTYESWRGLGKWVLGLIICVQGKGLPCRCLWSSVDPTIKISKNVMRGGIQNSAGGQYTQEISSPNTENKNQNKSFKFWKNLKEQIWLYDKNLECWPFWTFDGSFKLK